MKTALKIFFVGLAIAAIVQIVIQSKSTLENSQTIASHEPGV